MSKLTTMQETVQAELERIPDSGTPSQRDLRMAYNATRMRSLGKNGDPSKSAFDVLNDCIAIVQSNHPGVVFEYDETFFQEKQT